MRSLKLLIGFTLLSLLSCGKDSTSEGNAYKALPLAYAQKNYPALTQSRIQEGIESQTAVTFSCIVEKCSVTNTEGSRTTEFRFFCSKSPKYGGIQWRNYNKEKLSIILNANQDKSIWLSVKAKFSPISAKYQMNPYTDPWCIVDTEDIYGFYTTEKYQFPPAHNLPEK